MKKWILSTLLSFAVSLPTAADTSKFSTGPLIPGFGMHAKIPGVQLSAQDHFKVAFDVAAPAQSGQVNRAFDSLARFLNMHVAAGVPAGNMELALVVHGKASFDLLINDSYQANHQQSNANLPLLDALLNQGVKIVLCGQSAAYHGIDPATLHPGVEVNLSAMTAHAQLQAQGYSLNPF